MKRSKERLGRPLDPGSSVVVGPWPLHLCEGCRERRPVQIIDAGQRGPSFFFCPTCLATPGAVNQALKNARFWRRMGGQR